MYLQPVPVGPKQSPDFRILVMRSVVLNQNGSLSAVRARQLLQERQVAVGVEDAVFSIMETRAPKFDGAQDLDVFTFAGHGDFRRMTHAAPGGMQRRILAEAGFVGKDQADAWRSGQDYTTAGGCFQCATRLL